MFQRKDTDWGRDSGGICGVIVFGVIIVVGGLTTFGAYVIIA